MFPSAARLNADIERTAWSISTFDAFRSANQFGHRFAFVENR